MKKKIAFVTPLYVPATIFGSQVFVQVLAELLADSGYDVSVITSIARTPQYWYDPLFGQKFSKKHELIRGVKVYRLPCFQLLSSVFFVLHRFGSLLPQKIKNYVAILSNGPYLLGLGQFFSKNQFDVVHVSPFPLGLTVQVTHILQSLHTKPDYIVTPFFHEGIYAYYNRLFQQVIDMADVVHVISSTESTCVQQAFKVSPKKIQVLPLFLHTTAMKTKKDLVLYRKSIQQQYGLLGKKIILFAGIKGKAKGIITLFESIRALVKNDAAICLVTIGADTEEWKKIKNKHTYPWLIDLPYQTEVNKEALFSLCDVYCVPSMSETFGLTYLEAWHKKKPVIGADIGTVRELIVKNHGGLVVPFGDVPKLMKAIDSLLSDKKHASVLGQNGYVALMRFYTREKRMPDFMKLFCLSK